MSPTDDDKQTKKTPRPNEVKNIPDGALIQRSTKGDLLAFFSYAKLPSGERPRKYIGKVFDLIFYPDPEFQAYPERFPRPIKGKPGRKPAPAPAADIPPVQAEATANPKPEKSEGIINGGKPANLECGAPALLLAAANKENVLNDLRGALYDVFGGDGAKLYERVLTAALFIAGNGYSMQRMDAWCDVTLCPKSLTSQRTSELFEMLGRRAAEVKSAFCNRRLDRFRKRCVRRQELKDRRQSGTLTRAEENELRILGETEFVSHDGTKLYCDSDHISLSQFGISKEGEFRRLISFSLLFSESDGIPLNYELRAGNVSDMHTLDEVLDLWQSLSEVRAQIRTVVDRGYASRDNLAVFSERDLPFLVAAQMSHSYMQKVKAEHGKSLVALRNYSVEYKVYGMTVPIEIGKGRIVYAHLYFDERRRFEERHELMLELEKYRVVWNLGKGRDKVCKSYADCFLPAKDGEVPEYNWPTIEARVDDMGFFGLISTDRIGCWHAMKAYKTRNSVEIAFRSYKDKGNMKTARCHNDATLQGKIFVTFIALTMISSIDRRLHLWKINPNLDKPNEPALNRNYSYGSLLDKVKSVRVIQNEKGETRLEGVTARLKQIAAQLGLSDAFVMEKILSRMGL